MYRGGWFYEREESLLSSSMKRWIYSENYVTGGAQTGPLWHLAGRFLPRLAPSPPALRPSSRTDFPGRPEGAPGTGPWQAQGASKVPVPLVCGCVCP